MTATWAAPGRVNLIGEHVDYNDGLVLPFALPFVTTARVAQRDDDTVQVTSEDVGSVEFGVDSGPDDVDDWGAYVAGVVWAFRQRSLVVAGLDVHISSDVPLGAGLSSSAALSCSVASAVNDECGLGLAPRDLANVARVAENEFVGVPTGAMDQLASVLCEAGHVMLLDCRSMDTTSIAFDLSDKDLTLLLINTGAEHSLVGGEYADRRHDCEAATAALGLESLRDATLEEVRTLGDERLRRRAHHVVSEIQRVQQVADVLQADRPADIGAFLSASHESMRDDFEISCEELDVTVEAALEAGALGARMTGGGFGGCAIALCRDQDVAAVERRVQAAYESRDWEAPTIWRPLPSQGAHRID